MQDGVVPRSGQGLSLKVLDPVRYHVHPKSDFTELERDALAFGSR